MRLYWLLETVMCCYRRKEEKSDFRAGMTSNSDPLPLIHTDFYLHKRVHTAVA